MNTLLILVAAAALAADPTWELELTSGDVLRGQLIERTDDTVVFEHPVLGRLTIPADAVKDLRELPAPGPAAAAPPAKTVVEAPPPEPEVLDDAIVVKPIEKVKGKWKSTFGLGINGSLGKTTETSLRLSFDSVYQDPKQKYTFDSFYLYKTTDNDPTDNKASAGIRGDWPFVGTPWGYFGQGRYDYDQFQSWRHRLTAGGGFTYLLVNYDRIDPEKGAARTDVLTLLASGGLGINEEFGSTMTGLTYEVILGLDFAWAISERQQLVINGTLFPSISDGGEYRFVSRGGWSLQLDRLDGIALTAGYYYEYQSMVDVGVDHNDLQFFISLGINF